MSSPFVNITQIAGTFTATSPDTTTDFVATGDAGTITITGSGYGEGGFGEGGYGGDITIVLSNPTTIWTNIETP